MSADSRDQQREVFICLDCKTVPWFHDPWFIVLCIAALVHSSLARQ
jgi:hypothetical protein